MTTRARFSSGSALRDWVVLEVGALCVAGIALAALFHLGFVPPIKAGVAALAILGMWGLVAPTVTPLGILPRFMTLVYVLPFSVLIGYLFDGNFVWTLSPRHQNVAGDALLMRQLVTVGLIGLLGLLAGIRCQLPPQRRVERQFIGPPERTRALALVVFLALAAAAVGLAWLAAPPETILHAGYAATMTASRAAQVNFPAAFLVAYITLILLTLDAEREPVASRRHIKIATVAAGVLIVVVAFQMLRGQRSSIGLIVAVSGIYLTSPLGVQSARAFASAMRRRLKRALPLLAGSILAYVALGGVRGAFSEASAVLTPAQMVRIGLAANTWTAVLWTNLGAAWEYRTGYLRYKYGQTYVDYALSLPPGVVASALRYERPVESWRGISWENPAGVTSGGLHVVIAPFKNFGAFGAFFVLAIYGYVLAVVERNSRRGRLFARFLWASVLCVGLTWFWYGDMPFIRAFMSACLLYVGYRVALSFHLPPIRVAYPHCV